MYIFMHISHPYQKCVPFFRTLQSLTKVYLDQYDNGSPNLSKNWQSEIQNGGQKFTEPQKN